MYLLVVVLIVLDRHLRVLDVAFVAWQSRFQLGRGIGQVRGRDAVVRLLGLSPIVLLQPRSILGNLCDFELLI